VRIGGTHLPKTVKRWLGDSIGHWEGDTLVVETTNFTDNTRFIGLDRGISVSSSASRASTADAALSVPVEDPKRGRGPWTAEYTWPTTGDLMYEYACHEGNYAMATSCAARGSRKRRSEQIAPIASRPELGTRTPNGRVLPERIHALQPAFPPFTDQGDDMAKLARAVMTTNPACCTHRKPRLDQVAKLMDQHDSGEIR
jgi:hypothetical protein